MERLFGKNWRTTTLGILGLLGVVSTVGTALVQGQDVNWTLIFTQVATSIGLFRAGDAKNIAP